MNLTWWKRKRRRNKKPTELPLSLAQHWRGQRYLRRMSLEPLEERRMLTQVVWANPNGGDWDTPSNWVGGMLPGPSVDVVINSLNSGATVTHSQSSTDSVNSITAAAPITLSGGTLIVAGAFSDTSAVTLSGGTLGNASVQTGTVLQGNGSLNGVTLAGTLDENAGGSLTIVNGLTLASGLVETTNTASLNFNGTQTLAGTGEVLFNGGNNHNNRINLLGSDSVLTIGPNITIDGLTATINAGSGTIDNYGALSVGSSGGTQSTALSGGTFTIDGAWTNESGATLQAVNDGNLVLNAAGANDSGNTVPSGVWTNDAGATVSVTGNSDHGGGLSLEGNGWSNAGAITMTNSSVFLGGSFTLATLGAFGRSGGTVNLTGTLTNIGTTLALNNTTGTWMLDGGTIIGGTISTSGTALLQGEGSVNGVTLDGTLDGNVFGGSLTIINGLTLASGLVETTNIESLNFSGTQTLAGTGEVLFNGGNNPNNGINLLGSGSVLTIGPNITLDGLTARIILGSGTVDNYGTLSVGSSGGTQSAALSGGTFTIDGAWTNETGATMQAVNDGNLVLNSQGANDEGNIIASGVWTNDAGATISVIGNSDHGGSLSLEGNGWSNAGAITMTNSTVFLGSFTLAALGAFSRSGGTVNLNGTLANSGLTLALNNTTGSWQLAGGTILGGTITTAGTAELVATASGGTLAGVTLAGTLDSSVNNASTLTVTGGLTLANVNINVGKGGDLAFSGSQTLGGAGTVTFSDSSGNNALFVTGNGNTLIIGPNITIQGNTGSIVAGNSIGGGIGNTSTFINEGTISSDTAQGQFSFLATNWINEGTIEALNDSYVDFGGNTSASSAAGSFTNSGTILGASGFIYLKSTLNNVGSTLALTATTGSWYLTYGTINGGTVSTSGGAELIGTNDGGTLAGVDLAGTLDLANTFTHATVTVSGGLALNQGVVNIGASSSLIFQGSQSLSGAGSVNLANVTAGDGLLVPASGATMTIAAGVAVQGNSGVVGSSGGGLITNQGTIEATGGGSLTVQGFTNFASGTLTGGTWGAVGGSSLLLVGANIGTNAANIILDGVASHIYSDSSGATNALAGFTTNAAAGSFTIQNGANFTSGQAFTNAGMVTIDSNDAFIPGGTGVYTQTGGTTILSAGTLGSTGNQINIQGGTLSGPGTVNANLTNAGEVDLGSNPGILAVKGNYTQTAAGALTIKVGGATAGSLFDQVNVTGTATLNGTLNVTLINGYAPGLEVSYDVLNFSSSSGSFATFNSPQINSNPAFTTSATPTSFDLIGTTNAPDLAVSNIAFTPANPTLNQDVTVTYNVTNLGTVATTAGSWTDSVYLSTDAVVDANAVLLGRATHSGDLPAQAQYTGSLTAAVPGLLVGSYHVIVVVDSGLVVPDINRANNTAVATTELSTQPPLLAVGTPLSGTIANGQDLYYRLNVTPGTNVKLDATFSVAAESELYVSFGALPTVSSFDQSSTNLNDLQPELILPSGQGGAYYLWLHGAAGAGAGQPFTLQASLTTFAATSFTPSTASNQGQATMDVTGSGFTSQTTVSLQDGSGHTLNAQTVTYISANELNATFDLTQLPVGNYSVVAADSGKSSTAPGSFQVIAQAVSSLLFTLSVNNVSRSFETNPPAPTPGGYTSPPPIVFPSGSDQSSGGGGGGAAAAGPAAPFTVGLTVENKGTDNVDIPAIEVDVSSASPPFFIIPATTLAPFASEGSYEQYTPNPLSPGTQCNVTIKELPPQTVLDWATQELGNRPPTIPVDTWNAILANFIASVGNTQGSLDAALQADAIYLAQVGDPVTSEGDLMNFELEKAEDAAPMPTLTSAVDASFAEPGLPLTFERSFQQPLGYRNQLGSLGYGWTSNWNIAATTGQNGNVYIQQGALTSEFVLNANKSYQSPSGNKQEVLTLANGSYALTGSNGSVTAFLPDGLVNYVQDANGNRITAGYTSGLLTSLTHSDGDQLMIGYNAQGLIGQITDPAGNVTTYTYDANDQLTSVANAQGTTQYTYVNGQGIAEEHAMASITFPAGTHSYFSYDSQGRLIEQSSDNGAGAVKYAYLSPGGYTETDANGAVTKVLTNLAGQPAVVTDPLGNVSRVTYNANGQPMLTSYPGGTASSEQYDAQGNLISQTDALGNSSHLTTNPQTGTLTTFENANGASTSFAYTSQGELAAITQPDGTTSQYIHNPQGQVTGSIDAEGRETHYAYDSHGRLIRTDFPDGTYAALAYDADNNVTSVTNASGAILMTYDSANRLTRITYPNGQFLKYTYNTAGQLAQIVDQTGFAENYAYNNLGQLAEVTDANGNLIVSYSYDLGGRLVGEVNGNGTYTTYTYDANGNVLSLVNFAPNASINSSFSYTYNALNLVTSMITASGTTTYGYDADGQLTSVVLPTGETITYQYDAVGNRTAVSDNGATTKYTSDNTNEYTSVGSATYGYDPNGNLTMTTGGPGGTTTYTYDDENRLIEEQTPADGDTWTFQYDALGNLAASTDNGQTTQYLVNPSGLGTVAAEFDGSGNLIANFTYGAGLVSQVTAAGTTEFYDYDALGSTAGLSGQSGTYLASYSYLPFGEVQSTTGTAANPFQYNGKLGVMALGTGLNYMRARFYSSTDGRFINRDPIGLAGGTNAYTFAHNDPTAFVDPSGRSPLLIDIEVAQQFFTATLRLFPDLTAAQIDYVAQEALEAGESYAAYGAALEQAAADQAAAAALDALEYGNTVALDPAATAALEEELSAPFTETLLDIPIDFVEDAAVDVAEEVAADVLGGIGLAGSGLVVAGAAGGLVGYGIAQGLDAFAPNVLIGIGAAINWLSLDAFTVAIAQPVNLSGSYKVEGPVDPNSIYGPGGFGPQGFIPNTITLPYVITFDNKPTANAPAQIVTVTQQLDSNLDWSTFQLDDFDFGGQVYAIPAGLTSYSTVIDATSTVGVYVDVNADFDPLTGFLTWTFTSIDPTTLDLPVGNVEEGFLPPDVTPPEGEGFVSYVVLPKANDPTGAIINAQGTVIFQAGLPNQSSLATPTIFNTIDNGPPTSSVNPLPTVETSSNFNVSWSGQDNTGGSGIASYDVYVSDNGGTFTKWQSATTQTSATYAGVSGHTYGFYSVATDNVGNVQPTPTSAQATTTAGASSGGTIGSEIIDNSQPGFWASGSGTWTTVNTGLNGTSLLSATTPGSMQSQAAWWFSMPAGVYEISITYTAGSNLTKDMGLDLYDGVGNWIGQIPVNEQVAPNSFTEDGVAWEDLGAFKLTSNIFHVSTWNSQTDGAIEINGIQLQAAPIVDDGNVANAYKNFPPAASVGTFSTSGSWTTSGQGAYGGSHVSAGTAGSGASEATWTMPVTPGSYEVDVTWPSLAGLSASAAYVVYDGTTKLGSVAVNQQSAPSGVSYDGVTWQSLGSFTISAAQLTVTLANTAADGQVDADAIRIVPAYQPTPIVASNGYPGFWSNTNWTTQNAGVYGMSMVSDTANGSKQSQAAWWFPVQPGQYEVDVTWAPGSNLSPTAPFDVYNALTYISEPTVDETKAPVGVTDQGVVWQSLGTFTMTSDVLHVSTWNSQTNGAMCVNGIRIVPVSS